MTVQKYKFCFKVTVKNEKFCFKVTVDMRLREIASLGERLSLWRLERNCLFGAKSGFRTNRPSLLPTVYARDIRLGTRHKGL